MDDIIYGKLTIKGMFFIPSRDPSRPARSFLKTLHTEHHITEKEAVDYSQWFKKDNKCVLVRLSDANPYMAFEWQAYPVTIDQ